MSMTKSTKTIVVLAVYAAGLVLPAVPVWGIYAGALCCAGATLLALRGSL